MKSKLNYNNILPVSFNNDTYRATSNDSTTVNRYISSAHLSAQDYFARKKNQ